MSPGRELKDFSRELRGANYCSSVNSSSDESTEGQNLQSVLVTVRIQRKPKPKNVKRVRFNSLVEVRFIPKVKRQDGPKCFQGKECKDDKKKRKNRKGEQEDAKAIVKGAQVNSKEVVTMETKDNLCLENKIKESSDGKKNFATEKDEDTKRIKDINNITTTTSECKNSDTADVQSKEIEVKVTDELGAEQDEREELSEISIKVSYATTRQVFTPPKVVVGENYTGLALKPAFPRVSASRTSYRSYRQTMKQSKLQDLNILSLDNLNKHATSLCKEADTFLTECDEHNGEQSCESTASDSQTPTIQPLIPIHKDQEGYTNMSDRGYTCQSQSPLRAYNQHDSASITKLYTNLTMLNKKGVAYSPLKSDSYCRLYLPQLQRKCEEINRLNDAILRRNPKYTRGITETNRYFRPRTTVPMPKYGKFGKLNRLHSPTVKLSEHNTVTPKSVLKYRYSSESVQLTKRRGSSNMFS